LGILNRFKLDPSRSSALLVKKLGLVPCLGGIEPRVRYAAV